MHEKISTTSPPILSQFILIGKILSFLETSTCQLVRRDSARTFIERTGKARGPFDSLLMLQRGRIFLKPQVTSRTGAGEGGVSFKLNSVALA